ncbi:MAG TPA: undecaprenyl-phosphate glucose phosphotransferase [Solimonas sp.]|nr:undecaprenyl-phosphate glucose phosphotransferase [Solimonas sp.]
MNASGRRPVSPNQTRAARVQGVIYAAAITGTLYVLARALHMRFSVPYQVLAIITATFGYFIFQRFDLTTPWMVGRPGATGTRMLYAWAGLVGALLFIAYTLKYSAYFSRAVLLLWIFATPAVLLLIHWTVRGLVVRYLPHMSVRRSAVIVFVNDSARALAQNLEASPFYEMVGYFDDRDVARLGGGIEHVTYLGKAHTVAQYVKDHDVQVVFVVLPDEGITRAVGILDELGDTTASVYYVPDIFIFNLLETEISEVEGIPVLQVAETPFYGVDGLLKHLFDLSFAAITLLLISPLLLLIALAIKLDSPGPVVFRQKRYGLNGKGFHVWKFRSMRVADGDTGLVQASRHDPRVTRVGRFLRRTSMDELLQFINVLKGDMSVVGPRPHPVALNEHYRKAIKRYMVRHKVKPGLTGWAQIHGLRGETAELGHMEERIRFDLEYIRNWSPLLDVRIIVATMLMVVRDKNAY